MQLLQCVRVRKATIQCTLHNYEEDVIIILSQA